MTKSLMIVAEASVAEHPWQVTRIRIRPGAEVQEDTPIFDAVLAGTSQTRQVLAQAEGTVSEISVGINDMITEAGAPLARIAVTPGYVPEAFRSSQEKAAPKAEAPASPPPVSAGVAPSYGVIVGFAAVFGVLFVGTLSLTPIGAPIWAALGVDALAAQRVSQAPPVKYDQLDYATLLQIERPEPVPQAQSPVTPGPTPEPAVNPADEPRQGTQSGDGWRYKGTLVGRSRHGHGKLTFDTGHVYEGEFESNLYHGFGTLSYADGGGIPVISPLDVSTGSELSTMPLAHVMQANFQMGNVLVWDAISTKQVRFFRVISWTASRMARGSIA